MQHVHPTEFRLLISGALCALLCGLCSGGELEQAFAKPPADAEPAASAEAKGDLFKIKVASDLACIDGSAAVTCNRDWPGAKELVKYVARCRALLRAGKAAPKADGEFAVEGADTALKYARYDFTDGTAGFFVAYPADGKKSEVKLSFAVTGKYPELWDPATGKIVQPKRRDERGGRNYVVWQAEPGAAVIVMFRPERSKAKKETRILESQFRDVEVTGSWNPAPNGAEAAETVYKLADGVVKTSEDAETILLDLGNTKGLVEIKVNGKKLAPLWKPPYRADVSDALAFEPDEHTIAPGASVNAHAPVEVELKVYGTLGTPSWRAVSN